MRRCCDLVYSTQFYMSNDKKQHDFRFAIENTEVVLPPRKTLETFGNTLVNYHLVSELMDAPGKVRIREGRLQALKPLIIVPDVSAMETDMEGFGEQAREYVKWLKENGENLRILQYGYTLKQEAFSEQIVTDTISSVLDRVVKDVKTANGAFDAVVKGVDDPWDVCLVKLFMQLAEASLPYNLQEFEKEHSMELIDGIPGEVRREVEKAFSRAEKDYSAVRELGELLQRLDVFEQYQDRFFRLVRR